MLSRSTAADSTYCCVRSSVAATAEIGAAVIRRPRLRTACCVARRSTMQDTDEGRLVQFGTLTGVKDVR